MRYQQCSARDSTADTRTGSDGPLNSKKREKSSSHRAAASSSDRFETVAPMLDVRRECVRERRECVRDR